MLITIEGPDKAGKTTQIEMLKGYASENSKNWFFTRNPGGTPLGKELREIVLHTDETISDRAELMIYLADRADHVDHVLKPAMEEGKIIICDRFIDSTVAYQGYGRGIDISLIERMNNLVCEDIKPDLTVLLTVSEGVAAKRSEGSTKDRLERENKLFFVRVRNGYMAIARKDPARFIVIETDDLSPEEVHKKLIESIEERIAKKLEAVTHG